MSESIPRPPRLAELLLRLVVGTDPAGRSVLGDAREEFASRGQRSRFGATVWYWGYVLHFTATYRTGAGARRACRLESCAQAKLV